MRERKIVVDGDLSGLENAFERGSSRAASSLGKVDKAMGGIDSTTKKTTSNLSNQIEELEQNTSSLFNSMTQDAEKFGRTSKERAQYLKDEIDLIKRAAKEEEIRSDIKARLKLEESKGGSKQEQEGAKKTFQKESQEIRTRAKMANMQAQALESKASGYIKGDKDSPDDGGGGGGSRVIDNLRKEPRRVFNATAGAAGFGAILSIAGFVGKMVQEGAELDNARARSSAAGIGMGGGIQGMKSADVLRYNLEASRELGYGGQAGANEASKLGRMEKAMGLDMGTMKAGSSVLRSEEFGKTQSQAAIEMLAIMKSSDLYNIGKGDFTMVGELLSRSNELNELQASQNEKTNSLATSQVMASFGQIGGSFSDRRQTATISTINDAISNPNNDFKRAFTMSSIRKRDPNASYFEMMENMEQGAFSEGQLSGIMSDLKAGTGGEEEFAHKIQKFFGLKFGQSRTLAQGYNKDSSIFDNIRNEDDVRAMADSGLVRRATTGGVGNQEKIMADWNDWFAEKGEKGWEKLGEYKDAYDDPKNGGLGGLMSKVGNDIVDAIDKGFKKAMGIEDIVNERADPEGYITPTSAAYSDRFDNDKYDVFQSKEDRTFGFDEMVAIEKTKEKYSDEVIRHAIERDKVENPIASTIFRTSPEKIVTKEELELSKKMLELQKESANYLKQISENKAAEVKTNANPTVE